jgi:class 3 adenylate cyclase/tetratricopeptide (TPR) repeat protein
MYTPQPIDTSEVQVSEELRDLIELLARNTHDVWAQKRMADGWRYGLHRDDVNRQHPGLVPYDALPVSEQDYDRAVSMAVVKTILALGYRIETAPDVAAAVAAAPSFAGEAPSERSVERILKTLQAPGAKVLDLLHLYLGETYAAYWQQDVRLYRAFGRKLIDIGQPTRAFELVRQGLMHHATDAELVYISALALRRGGNVSKALEYVNDLLQHGTLDANLRVEVLSLAAALHKVRYTRTRTSTRKVRFAREAARLYEHAHHLSGDWFPGINAATMSLLAGRHQKAQDLAAIVIDQAKAALQRPGGQQDHWCFATLGEASLILDDPAAAASWYRKAVHLAANQSSSIAAMRGNIQLLQQKVNVGERILRLFDVGNVVVFSGHVVDHPARLATGEISPRFPADAAFERRVSLAIKKAIEQLNATIGYCSAACGADLLFAEHMLARGAELHVILPFDQQDFYVTSVDYGLAEMAKWRQRCDDVLARATEVHYATTEGFLGDHVLFEFANTFTQGLAITHATQLGLEPYALAVLDPTAEKHVGGTGYFVAKWHANGRQSHIIDLAACRAAVRNQPPMSGQGRTSQRATVRVGTRRREIKAMLFADVKNFSKLGEALSPTFLIRFLNIVADVMRMSHIQPAFCNTWGDGLFLVFDTVVECAEFATRLLERMARVNWEKAGLPADIAVRMGLHAGPVYRQRDPIIDQVNFFGTHVNRAARIEPVATPGCAFTSEQFAAALMVASGHNFVCEYVGVEKLAKDYDRCPLYRLSRRG